MHISVSRLLAAAVCLGCCVFAINLSGGCESQTTCKKCQTTSDACGWCYSSSSQDFRCTSLETARNSSDICLPCHELPRVARQANRCDRSGCMGVKDEVCSGHGTCVCDTCTCEPRYKGAVCQNCPSCWGELCRPLANCARCVKREGNATLCNACPLDTQLMDAEPVHSESSECVFDTLSIVDDSRCSFRVRYWRDDLLELHTRIQLRCGSARGRFPFGAEAPAADSSTTTTTTTTGMTTTTTTTAAQPPVTKPLATAATAATSISSSKLSQQVAPKSPTLLASTPPPTAGGGVTTLAAGVVVAWCLWAGRQLI
ncbi:integrin beta-3-like [Pollicipes pollicipes]|uniref:integrin beta-3-like n=1 Tax=Pollicipes pollicipes TaxID=41117 RepID=UPI00188553D3|nr:integrin beta-3-like [Pollicipes pollicipes]